MAELSGRWTHAHERDGEGTRVFVGPEIKLGPSRGRRVLDFSADGGFEDKSPGPTDKSETRSGRYLNENDSLIMTYQDGSEQRYQYRLLANNALELRRQ